MQNASEGGQNHQSEPQRRTNQQLQRPRGGGGLNQLRAGGGCDNNLGAGMVGQRFGTIIDGADAVWGACWLLRFMHSFQGQFCDSACAVLY